MAYNRQREAYFKGKRAEEAFCKLTKAKPSSAKGKVILMAFF